MSADDRNDHRAERFTEFGSLQPGEGQHYRIDRRVLNAARTRLFEPDADDPASRPLEIFALDPAVSKLEGGVVSLSVPYEPLQEGPVGSVVEVSNIDAEGNTLDKANLEDPAILMQGGYKASLSRPEFHQQMVYAVAMHTYGNFSKALGRSVSWAFEPPSDPGQPNRLLLKPHGAESANAWYDGAGGEITFGYFKPKVSTPVVPKDSGHLFTCVSHDIIAHEVSHALLDGLRTHFDLPTHQETLAFHEAFADLVAFLQHFTFDDVVSAQLGRAKGQLENASELVSLARNFGLGLGLPGGTLRTVWDSAGTDRDEQDLFVLKDDVTEPHELGQVLIYAIFDAFLTIYNRKAKRYIKLSTVGTGVLPEGDISPVLQEFLVEEVRELARQFLSICIRAIDYCPPVDVRFGDYLRAMITADRDAVSDDKWAYREAIIRAFGRRQIFGEGTASMTEDALAWNGPRIPVSAQEGLSFGRMRFDADPGRPASPDDMRAHAGLIGRLISRPELADEFGLVAPGSEKFARGKYDLPVVTSVRSMRRIGPDQEVAFDTVAEVVQSRRIGQRGSEMTFYGGSSIIFGPRGNVRYVINKRVDNDARAVEQAKFARSKVGRRFWTKGLPDKNALKKLCVAVSQPNG